jgi:quinol monooxygenase YgiN
MPLDVFVRFDPKAGKESQLRDALAGVVEPTRTEPGCMRIHFYESIRGPLIYFIHSVWIDEAAFEAHAELPHTRRFVGVVGDLIANPFQAVRTSCVTD